MEANTWYGEGLPLYGRGDFWGLPGDGKFNDLLATCVDSWLCFTIASVVLSGGLTDKPVRTMDRALWPTRSPSLRVPHETLHARANGRLHFEAQSNFPIALFGSRSAVSCCSIPRPLWTYVEICDASLHPACSSKSQNSRLCFNAYYRYHRGRLWTILEDQKVFTKGNRSSDNALSRYAGSYFCKSYLPEGSFTQLQSTHMVLSRQVVGAPPSFIKVWEIIKKWFDPGSVAKVLILPSSEVERTLADYIEPENLPRQYGGKHSWEWGDMPDLGEMSNDASYDVYKRDETGVRRFIRGPVTFSSGRAHVWGYANGKPRWKQVAPQMTNTPRDN